MAMADPARRLYLRASRARTGAYLDGPCKPEFRPLTGRPAATSRADNLLLAAGKAPVALIARPLAADGVTCRWSAGFGRKKRRSGSPGGAGHLRLARRSADHAAAGGQRRSARTSPGSGATIRGRPAPSPSISRTIAALTGDRLVNDAAVYLLPVSPPTGWPMPWRRWPAPAAGNCPPGEIRATSLRIFDRTFAVTYVLEPSPSPSGWPGRRQFCPL